MRGTGGEMAGNAELISSKREMATAERARYEAKAAPWDLGMAVFFVAVLSITVILMFQGVETKIMTPAAAIGLALGWFMGWKKGQELYEIFYREKLENELKEAIGWAKEEVIEAVIQKAPRQRLG